MLRARDRSSSASSTHVEGVLALPKYHHQISSHELLLKGCQCGIASSDIQSFSFSYLDTSNLTIDCQRHRVRTLQGDRYVLSSTLNRYLANDMHNTILSPMLMIYMVRSWSQYPMLMPPKDRVPNE